MGGQTSSRRPRAGGMEIFWKFCFEVVHFDAKVTNSICHHWFSGGYSEKTDLRLITIFCHNFGVRVEPV